MNRNQDLIRGTGIVSFVGHETFTLRHGWLKKAVDAVRKVPDIFTTDQAMVELGVGKNMVRSIRHWALATNVLMEEPGCRGRKLQITELGDALFGPTGTDPYMEDLNTLWLVHWKLATNERRSTAWTWAFNLLPWNDFSRESLKDVLDSELKRRNIVGPTDGSLRRDIDCLLRTYVAGRLHMEPLEDTLESPLIELQLMSSVADGHTYAFNRGSQLSLSDEIFLYAVLEFWAANANGRQSIAFTDLAFGFGSPGLVFKLDENSIASRLERSQDLTRGALDYSDTAGLKQLYMRNQIKPISMLHSHFERAISDESVAI